MKTNEDFVDEDQQLTDVDVFKCGDDVGGSDVRLGVQLDDSHVTGSEDGGVHLVVLAAEGERRIPVTTWFR